MFAMQRRDETSQAQAATAGAGMWQAAAADGRRDERRGDTMDGEEWDVGSQARTREKKERRRGGGGRTQRSLQQGNEWKNANKKLISIYLTIRRLIKRLDETGEHAFIHHPRTSE